MELMRFRDWLSNKQRIALDALLTLASTLEAAKMASVTEGTVLNWLSTDKWFGAALQLEGVQLLQNAYSEQVTLSHGKPNQPCARGLSRE